MTNHNAWRIKHRAKIVADYRKKLAAAKTPRSVSILSARLRYAERMLAEAKAE